jgi:hypothetical protein
LARGTHGEIRNTTQSHTVSRGVGCTYMGNEARVQCQHNVGVGDALRVRVGHGNLPRRTQHGEGPISESGVVSERQVKWACELA